MQTKRPSVAGEDTNLISRYPLCWYISLSTKQNPLVSRNVQTDDHHVQLGIAGHSARCGALLNITVSVDIAQRRSPL